jgi:PAS domain S-box-containing protein
VGDPSPLLVATDEWLAAVEELEVAEEELRHQSDELASTADAVRSEHARYQELFELAPDAYLVTNASGAVRESNRAAAALFRIPAGFLDGKPLAVFVHPDDRRVFRDCIDALCAEDRVERWEMQLRPRYGPPAYVSVAASASRDRAGTVDSIRWILRDITEQRRASDRIRAVNTTVKRRVGERSATMERTALERDARIALLEHELAKERAALLAAESLAARRTDLLGILSHEIRTPLHASQGYLELLELSFGEQLAGEQRNYLSRMHQCQAYLVNVLEGVLALSRLERGVADLELAHVSVDAVLSTIPALVEPQVLEKHLRLEHSSGDPAVTVRADREKLQQIVINLVTNAVKFTPAGGAISVSWEATPDSVCIRVSDTGDGIRPADLERIFEPFVQGQVPRGARHGVGLGLAISRQLARLMNGDLAVVSAVGEGATFSLRLPRHADP